MSRTTKEELRIIFGNLVSALEELMGAWDALLFVLLFPIILPTALIWKKLQRGKR